MKTLIVVAIVVSLGVGLAGEAHAVLGGNYRCTVSLDEDAFGNLWFPILEHYNPNPGAQSIRRIRVFDSTGTLVLDTGPIPAGAVLVAGRGALAFVPPFPALGLFQIVVSFSQAVDGQNPLARMDVLLVDSGGAFKSVARTHCP